VKNGQPIYRNMRLELVTEDELRARLRRSGFDKLEEVIEAYMEGDGSITAVGSEKQA
jgi:uncharacterized membrane protein YcaP (DUF421 family)